MKSIIIDERTDEKIEKALCRLGFNPMKLPSSDRLPEAICSHPDSLIFKCGKNLFTYASYTERGLELFSDVREYHSDLKLHFVFDEPGKEYPSDCKLNALLMGNKLFAREKGLSEAVKKYVESSGIKIVNTNQGYPACTTLALGNSHAITADKGMEKVLSDEGIKVLAISSGGISLPPYEYGFIGGASFVYQNKVYFFGNLDSHKDSDKIADFVKGAGYQPISLSDGGLIDLGGAVIID